MIRIQGLAFAYPHSTFQLRVASLEVEAGTATAVVGPSGSGKTTLLHLIAGILPPHDGTVIVGDSNLSQMSESARRRFRLTKIGLVFQSFELIEYLNVLDNVLLPCRINNALPLTAEIRKRAEDLIEQVGLGHLLRNSVTRLSQGERQRVAICRALLTRPAVLLADEPTGNLDPFTSGQILQLLLNTVRDEGATLLMVTHDHSLLSEFDRTVDFAQFLTTAPAADSSGASS